MSVHENITDLYTKMNNSPIREMIRSEKKSPLEIDTDFISEDTNRLKILIDNLREPLKVVVMGEVKAGKSTLLNAFAAEQLSPMNVSEATASILEIVYSEKPYGKIVMKEDEIKGTPKEIFQLLEEKQNDQFFFKECDHVEIGYPLPNLLNFTLVDTPGLETVTDENSDRTKIYLGKTDVVLWVFNGNHLGQSDIEDALLEVNKFGKPIIAIVNRVDEVDAEPEEITEYMEEQIGMYVKKVFPLSAKMALEGRKNNNQEVVKESGFKDILDYLDKNISKQVDLTKQESVLQSADALLSRDLLKHSGYIDAINFIEKESNEVRDRINENKSMIQRKIMWEFDNWYSRDFLEKERQQLKNLVEDSGALNIKGNLTKVEKEIPVLLSNDNVSEKLNEMIKKTDISFEQLWQGAINNISKDTLLKIQEFQEQAEAKLQMELSQQSFVNDKDVDVVSGATKGALLGGATGAAGALYAAALGPAASVVTLGVAASTMLPPLLIVGAAFGAVSTFMKLKSEKNIAIRNIDEAIQRIKEENKAAIYSTVENLFIERGETISRNLESNILKSFSNNEDFDGLIKLKMAIEKYLYKLKDHQQLLVLENV
ncbi:dynamin family protein [Planococcus wigleyi]|uniref:Dynamin family protein n=1 Tax=Planococcus wigleyi TaxID=2762216 RepID=A0ABR8W8T0_9BACL|nr:dynamin family protein [Planococcus wigleyi]MBD8013387.1 dynamin family protein [Planococcus wigleyi]